MILLPKSYLELLQNRDFFILSLVIFIGQLASAFLVLALIISVFVKTGSNFGVSGVVLSFAVPSFLLMAFSGIVADVFDRRKIIIVANFFIALVVLVIILAQSTVYATIPLAFLYFAGNSFFIPASAAATAQLVRKNQLLVANSIFIFNLAGGVLFGLFLASVVYFFFGDYVTLLACEALLVIAALLSLFLKDLRPFGRREVLPIEAVKSVIEGFRYIFSSEVVWFFFVAFAAIQGIIFFGITLAPGFFTDIVGVSIEKSILIIFPMIGVGVYLGINALHLIKRSELFFVSLGTLVMGLALLVFGLTLKAFYFPVIVRILLAAPFLVMLGFGAILIMIASRTVLQKKVNHAHQGTVFGANIVLASVLAAFSSPMAAVSEVILGYLGTLVGAGVFLTLLSVFFFYFLGKWRY